MDRSLGAGIAVAVALYCFFIIGALAQESPEAGKVWSYGEMKWQEDKVLQAVRSVPLWGDPTTGEHGMLLGSLPRAMHRHRTSIRSGNVVLSRERSSCGMPARVKRLLVPVRTQKSLHTQSILSSAGNSQSVYSCWLRRDLSRSFRALLRIIRNHQEATAAGNEQPSRIGNGWKRQWAQRLGVSGRVTRGAISCRRGTARLSPCRRGKRAYLETGGDGRVLVALHAHPPGGELGAAGRGWAPEWRVVASQPDTDTPLH